MSNSSGRSQADRKWQEKKKIVVTRRGRRGGETRGSNHKEDLQQENPDHASMYRLLKREKK